MPQLKGKRTFVGSQGQPKLETNAIVFTSSERKCLFKFSS